MLAPLTEADIRDLRLVSGDILVCEGGEIGRSSVWKNNLPEAYFLNTLHRLRSKGRYEPLLLVSVLEHMVKTGELSALVGKSSLAHLTKENLLRVQIPLPPPPEQKEVVASLSAADQVISGLERLIAKKKAIKKGLLHQLLTGETRLPGFSAPWRSLRLGEAAQFSKGAGLPKSDIRANGNTSCIHYGELFTHYGAEIETVTSRTDKVNPGVRSRTLDVLMPTSDVTPRGLAKASSIHPSGVILGGDILIIRADLQQIYGPFLAHAIRRDANQILQLVRGSTVFHIYAADMKSFLLRVPGVEEQRAICAVLRDSEREIQRLENRLAKARAVKVGMMQELLTGRTRLLAEGGPAEGEEAV
ncbi:MULTISPECIES: restriction endonuclease subunit S [unclassified Streptomyces]|uniref:restriction endonuclease subunit S n=1 Tax=unclassified Streptomyces TaxID=2593676 RepID=UPI003830C71D